MDLRNLSKTQPTVLNGHEGKKISAIQFQKNDKKNKETSSVTPKSKVDKSSPAQVATTSVTEKEESKRQVEKAQESKENRYGTIKQSTEISLTNSDIQSDASESMSQRKYSTENIMDPTGQGRKSHYTEHLRSRRQKIDKPATTKIDKNDLHLSEYGEAVSMHSSVLSTSSNVNKPVIPPIPRIQENNFFEMEKSDLRSMDVEMKDDRPSELDEFTDQQKEYIAKLLDEKLSRQRERMVSYFQNMQIEMIRQFQIQYLEMTEVMEEVIESKNRNKFVNNL